MGFEDVLSFWFEESTPQQHFKKDLNFDNLIAKRFGKIHEAARKGELSEWRETGGGRLAEVIVLDQFSRNIFRDRPESFAWDTVALVLAQEAVQMGLDAKFSSAERAFLYMPYMHSESKVIHQQAIVLFESLDSPQSLEFEIKHKKIIDRFGRYPHRNKILNRKSTPEELAFLQQPDSSF